MEITKITTNVRDLQEILHYKGLDREIRVKVGDRIYSIRELVDSSKDGLLLVCNTPIRRTIGGERDEF